MLDETEKTTNERRVESTRRRLGVLRPRSTSNDTISALRFCPKRLSLLLSPFLLVTVDAIFSFSFAPVYYRLVPSFSISFCSVARASETTRKGGRESGVAVRTRKTEREKSAQHRHLQFGSRSQPGERKMEKDRGFARVRRGSRIAGKREEEQGTRTKRRCQRDDETKQRENGFRTILGQGLSPVSSEITRPMRALAACFSPFSSYYFLLYLFLYRVRLCLSPFFTLLLSVCYLL